MKLYRWYFKITKELLENLGFNFFAKLKAFLGNYRIEEEDFRGYVIISFESNVPHDEGVDAQVYFNIIQVGEKIFDFSSIEYPK